MQAVNAIQLYNAGRDAERLQLKYRKMRGGDFPFLRATCHLFYDRLPVDGVFKKAPAVWMCGDLHIENFSSYKADNRLTHYDISDFDEAALAPASWDLVRLLCSLQVGATSIGIKPTEARALCNTFIETYAQTLAGGKAYWVERETSKGLVRELLDSLRDRQRKDFLASRVVMKNKRPLLRTDGSKALPASKADKAMVTEFMAEFARTQPNPGFFKVLGVARRIAGTGSLGVPRFVLLVHGKGGSDGHYLLDLKQTLASALLPKLKVKQPRWESEAHRVVALQSRLQAVSAAFLHPVRMDNKSWVLRELQPSEDRLTLDGSSQKRAELSEVVATMARIVAWAHLRSAGREGSATADELIAYGQRKKWRKKLLDASHEATLQVRRDAAAFNSAYDEGAFEA